MVYVFGCRCLKPNDEKASDNFCADYVEMQLKYTGVLETTRIRKCGFPTRLTYEAFLKRYNIYIRIYVSRVLTLHVHGVTFTNCQLELTA